MPRQSRHAGFTTMLAVVALTIAVPAGAETTGLLDQASAKAAADTSGTAFLTAGMVQRQAPPPPGGGGVPHQGVGVGVKGGFLWPSFAEAQGAGFEDNTGWLFGIWFGGNRGGTVGAMGEVQYGKRGGSFGSLNLDQYFIEIPILARINIGSPSLSGISVYGLVGPVFDILLKTKLEGVEIEDKYESLDIGLLIGGGIEITRFLIEARYNQGFKNVLKESGANISDIKTHSFAIEFGVRFN